MPSRGSNGLAPLCVKDKRKAQAQAQGHPMQQTSAPTGHPASNGHTNGVSRGVENGCKASGSECGGVPGSGAGSGDRVDRVRDAPASPTSGGTSPCGGYPMCSPSSAAVLDPEPVVVERADIIRLASQYTSCAGCSAAVKGLLQRPIEELRLVNAVMEEGCWAGRRGGAGGGGGNGGGKRSGKGGGARGGRGSSAGSNAAGAGAKGGAQHVEVDWRACDEAGAASGEVDWRMGEGEAVTRSRNGRGDPIANGQHHHSNAEPHPDSRCPYTGTCGGSGAPPAGDGPLALYLRKAYLTDRGRLDQVSQQEYIGRATTSPCCVQFSIDQANLWNITLRDCCGFVVVRSSACPHNSFSTVSGRCP